MSTKTIQTSIFGETSNNYAELQTTGRFIRPMLAIPAAAYDKFTLEFTDRKIKSRGVDPANVLMYEVVAFTDSNAQYTLNGQEPMEVGINYRDLKSRLNSVRYGKRTKDQVTLTFDEGRTLVESERRYNFTEVNKTQEVQNIDPNSVRDCPDTPDLEYDYQAIVEVDALYDVIKSFEKTNDFVEFCREDGDFIIAAGGMKNESKNGVAIFDDVANKWTVDSDPEASSLFSLDYLMDIVQALKSSLAQEVQIDWGDSIPTKIKFTRWTDDEEETSMLYTGTFLQAPRVEEDD